MLEKINALAELNFYLGTNYIRDEGAIAIGNGLTKLESLESLFFEVGKHNEIGIEGMKGLTIGLKQLNQLKKLKLTICENELG